MKKFLVLIPMLTLVACTHGNCRAQKELKKDGAAPVAAAGGAQSEVIVDKSKSTDRVRVFKPDGSLQCGQGKKIPVAEMQKDLKGIEVFSSSNQNDGMMRIQLCGTPTGNCNVYEIDRKNLEAALKLGFKEWLAE